MKLLKEELTKIVDKSILSDEDFQEAFQIAKENSSGRIWLIGGFLYKNIAHALYDSKKSTKDFDLIVEKANEELMIPEGWRRTSNHFNGIKFVNGEKQIDFIPLNDIYYISHNNLVPCIDNFLEGGALNIYCISYDILGKEILGEVGIKGLEQKTVSAYNLRMLWYGAELYGKTPNEMIIKKAEELKFKAQLI